MNRLALFAFWNLKMQKAPVETGAFVVFAPERRQLSTIVVL